VAAGVYRRSCFHANAGGLNGNLIDSRAWIDYVQSALWRLYFGEEMFKKTFSFWQRLMGRKTPEPQPSSEQDDRRVWVRYPAQLMTTFRPAGDEHSCLSALVRDVSQGGINLVVNKRLDAGQLLSIELPRSGAETHHVLACIVRVDKDHAGNWSLGCVFSSELSDDELQTFGARRSLAASSDQRKFIRYASSIKVTFEIVSDLPGQHEAQVFNISASGIGLLVSEHVEPGALLNVTMQSSSGSATRTILCCVVHVASQNEQWALGCNFIRQLNEADLQALL